MHLRQFQHFPIVFQDTLHGTPGIIQAILNHAGIFLNVIKMISDILLAHNQAVGKFRHQFTVKVFLLQQLFEVFVVLVGIADDPEIVPDLKKLMDYYLPMTVKLLDAYADMDAQPIQGETIENSKREIEATLDTLTLAFEKLLDDLFADTAMDVSSDISVLNTLLAQEGLTEDNFSKLKEQHNE